MELLTQSDSAWPESLCENMKAPLIGKRLPLHSILASLGVLCYKILFLLCHFKNKADLV